MKTNVFRKIISIFFVIKCINLIKGDIIPTEIVQLNFVDLKYSSLTKFYMYIDLSSYKEKEEAILTLKVEHTNEIKKLNAKYVSNVSKDKLMDLMPLYDTQFKSLDSALPGFKFLYFQMRESLQKTSYLLVYVELKSNTALELEGSIVLSAHEATSFVTEKSMNTRIDIIPYIPMILKYLVVKDVDFGDSYFFYFPVENYQTVYEGELLDDNDVINPNKTVDRLVMYTFDIDQPIDYHINITIVLFGPKTTSRLELWNTFSSVMSFHERKIDTIIHMEVDNSFNPFYILGSYQTEIDSLIYFEKLYGDFNLYYKDYINGIEISKVLPSYLDKTEASTYLISSRKNDIIMGECLAPCGFNIHFVSHPQPSEIKIGEKTIVHLFPKETLVIDIIASQTNDAINVEIQNIEGVQDLQVTIMDTKVPALDSVYRNEFILIEPKTIRLFCQVKALVAITIGTKKTYTSLTTNQPNQNSIYYFNQDLAISSFQITISNSDNVKDINMAYYIGYGVYPFIQDPIQQVLSKVDTISFTFSNPYLQEPPYATKANQKGEYYLIMSFDKQPNIAFKVTQIKMSDLTTLEEKKLTKVANLGSFKLKPVEKGRSFIYFITKCSKEESIVKFKYGTKTISGLYVTKQFIAEKYDNPFSNMMIEFGKSKREGTYPGVLFYYSYPTNAEASNIQFNDNFDIHYFDPNDNSTEIELQFDSPLLRKHEYDVQYDVYVYNEANDDPQYDICRAGDQVKSQITYKSNKLVIKLKLKLDRKKDNLVFITAFPLEGIGPMFSYNTIHLKQIEAKEPEMGLSYVWYIVIGLSVIIITLTIAFTLIYKRKAASNKSIDPLTLPNEALVDPL